MIGIFIFTFSWDHMDRRCHVVLHPTLWVPVVVTCRWYDIDVNDSIRLRFDHVACHPHSIMSRAVSIKSENKYIYIYILSSEILIDVVRTYAYTNITQYRLRIVRQSSSSWRREHEYVISDSTCVIIQSSIWSGIENREQETARKFMTKTERKQQFWDTSRRNEVLQQSLTTTLSRPIWTIFR